MSPVYREFAQDVAKRNAGEIGMDLQAPEMHRRRAISGDDSQRQPYLITIRNRRSQKSPVMTDILESMVGKKMLSHRAGRWAFSMRHMPGRSSIVVMSPTVRLHPIFLARLARCAERSRPLPTQSPRPRIPISSTLPTCAAR